MSRELFAGIPVTDYATALPWYQRFIGREAAFFPNEIEAVWEVAEQRYVYIVQDPQRAGNALVLWFVDQLDAQVGGIAGRGIDPVERATYPGDVTKVTYCDPEGNQISLGGRPS